VTPPVATPFITPPAKFWEVAQTSGGKVEQTNKRKVEDVCIELFPEKGLEEPDKTPAVAVEPPAPKRRASKQPKITSPPVEDKVSKPRGSDKVQRKPRGERLTFAGHRPPAAPALREQFLRIRQEYYDTKQAFKGDKKGKKKDDPQNWTPHATQLEYLQFMKAEMAKNNDGSTQEKFKMASLAWGQYCLNKGYVKNVSPEDVASPAAKADDMETEAAASAVDAEADAGQANAEATAGEEDGN